MDVSLCFFFPSLTFLVHFINERLQAHIIHTVICKRRKAKDMSQRNMTANFASGEHNDRLCFFDIPLYSHAMDFSVYNLISCCCGLKSLLYIKEWTDYVWKRALIKVLVFWMRCNSVNYPNRCVDLLNYIQSWNCSKAYMKILTNFVVDWFKLNALRTCHSWYGNI